MKRLVFLGALMLSLIGCAQHAPQALGDNEYVLTEGYDEVPLSVESRHLSKQAAQLCPTGYHFKLRQISAAEVLATHQFECAQGQDCRYVLQWHIVCGETPREPFSIFGKI
jgi:hypothetical protein